MYPAVLDIGFDGIVAGAGAHITLGNRVLYRRFLSEQTIRNVADFSARTGDVCILEGETGMFQVDIRGHSRYPWATIVSGDDFFARYPHEVITKLTYFCPFNADLEKLLSNLHVIRHPDYFEAVPAGCSKSEGLQRVLGELDIPRENSLAFGDSMNDLDMIAYAGRRYRHGECSGAGQGRRRPHHPSAVGKRSGRRPGGLAPARGIKKLRKGAI